MDEDGQRGTPIRASSHARWILGVSVVAAFSFWAAALSPGFWLSDSFAVYGKLEQGGFDSTFSCLYQLVLRIPQLLGMSIRESAVFVFLAQLGGFYALVLAVGRYTFGAGAGWLGLGAAMLTVANPVFPLMFGLQSVNSPANVIFAWFVYLTFRLLRGDIAPAIPSLAVASMGGILVALRLDMAPSVIIAASLLLWRSGRVGRLRFAGAVAASLLVFNVLLPRMVGYQSSMQTYLLTMIYRPMDKILAGQPELMSDPEVRGPIEQVIRMPVEKLVGHGEEMFWLDIDRRPSPAAWREQALLFGWLVLKRFDLFIGDRAALFIELLGSHRTSVLDDHLLLDPVPVFEPMIDRWGLRGAATPLSYSIKDTILSLLPYWSPEYETFWLWHMLPHFVLLLIVACLYPYMPATSAIAALVVVRTLVLAVLGHRGFYYYSTSLYLVSLLMILPFAKLERAARSIGRGSPALSESSPGTPSVSPPIGTASRDEIARIVAGE